MAATGERKDPFRGYKFKVGVDGITRAGFREASSLDSAQDPVEYRVISLKGGVTNDAELWAWRKKSIDGRIERKNGSIVLCDDTRRGESPVELRRRLADKVDRADLQRDDWRVHILNRRVGAVGDDRTHFHQLLPSHGPSPFDFGGS